MSQKPSLRVRKSGALLVAALIAFVGTLAVAGLRWQLTPLLLIPFGVGLWAWRAGTDVFPDRLRIRALFGSAQVPWSRIAELAPDPRGRISALLDNGSVLRLTGVTTDNLPSVLAAAGHQAGTAADDPEINSPPSPD